MTLSYDRLTTALSRGYRLERELGQGGMATVYLAQDLKHDRKVAIKVLRPELAAVIGAERFLSEIKTTANLQHPHILPLHDSGEADSFLFYVMPYVEGETVRDRIKREKQLPVADAVRITTEVASALDYAHRHGVIHRDIKPENILLHDGRALVADFGIALAASKSGGTRMTETGMSLGTPQYMSPEQAMGERDITARSDVYALGCVLYEMLTGEPPFTGTTAQAIVARVVTETPRPMMAQRHTIPPHVEAAVFTALEKLPADRFATAAEFATALANPGAGGSTVRTVATVRTVPASRFNATVAVVVTIAAIAVIAAWFRPQPPRPVSRFAIAFPDSQAPLGLMTITADGSRLVYNGPGDSARGQLWVKERDRSDPTPIPGTANASGYAVSPDGKWVAFVANTQLRKVSIGGGAAVPLAESAFGTGVAWLDDGSVVYTSTSFDLMRVPEAGGAATVLSSPSIPGRGLVFPTPLPGARGVLFADCSPSCVTTELWVLDLRSGVAKRLVPNALRGFYLSTGHLAYVGANGEMFAAPFDLDALEMRGTPVPVLSGVGLFLGFFPLVSVSSTGTLVMQRGLAIGGQAGRYQPQWVDRAGRRQPVDSAWVVELSLSGNNGWALSPDGTRMAIGLHSNSGDDIWIKHLPAGPLSRLTFDTTAEQRPRWSSDGKSVSYLVELTVLRQRRADGTGSSDSLLALRTGVLEGFRSRDGKWLIARTGGGASGRDIVGIRPGVDSLPVPLAANPGFEEAAPALSPDGRWLAYESTETGRTEVYIRPFPNTEDGKWQASTNGGQAPLWAHSGRELFFVDGARNMVATPVTASTSLVLGERRVLFRLGNDLYLYSPEYYTPFDISPDDKRFIMLRQIPAVQQGTPTFLLVENWFEELRARVKQ